MESLDSTDARRVHQLLEMLDSGPARLAGAGPAAFILPSDKWVYVEWDQKAEAHVLVAPE